MKELCAGKIALVQISTVERRLEKVGPFKVGPSEI
jgi:hypothetical protein